MKKFNKLMDAYIGMRGELAKSILKIVPPDTVEDIVQETYVKLCQLSNADDIEYPRAYCYRTVKNMALDHVRRFDQKYTDSFDEEATPLDAEVTQQSDDATYRNAVSHEQFGHLCDAVRRLPAQCRKVFVLKKVYNYSQKEIARELGISEKTVERHVALGLERCRDHMERYMPSEEAQSRSRGAQRGEQQ